jgi:hypothetical protein
MAARFELKQFTTPNFANMVPPEDVEERPIQKIEKFSTFLNEIPWFDKDEDKGTSNDESMLSSSEAGVTPDEMREDLNASMTEGEDIGKLARNRVEGHAPLGQSVELQLMKGAGDNEEDFGRALEAAELNRKLPTDLSIWDKAKRGREWLEAEAEKKKTEQAKYDFDPASLTPRQVKDWQKYLGVAVDGIWKGKTQAAFDKWKAQLRGE